MPGYFFNVHDGNLPEDEGIELPGSKEAHRQVTITAGEMLRETGREFWRETFGLRSFLCEIATICRGERRRTCRLGSRARHPWLPFACCLIRRKLLAGSFS